MYQIELHGLVHIPRGTALDLGTQHEQKGDKTT